MEYADERKKERKGRVFTQRLYTAFSLNALRNGPRVGPGAVQ